MSQTPVADVADVPDAVDVAWHHLLLGLAGHLPDDLLGDARTWLADGRLGSVARAVASAVTGRRLPLAAAEIALLREGLPGGHDLVAALGELAAPERSPAPWRFTALRPGDPAPPPGGLAEPAPDALDAPDRALVASAAGRPGVRGVWRAWRSPADGAPLPPPLRLAVVTVDPDTPQLSALAADLRGDAVAAGGDDVPGDVHVEVCLAGAAVPRYQAAARWAGVLLWAREPAAPVTVARVFDGVDVEGPWFAPDRARVTDPAGRERLLAALGSGTTVLTVPRAAPDVLDPGRGDVVPLHLRTDGRWVWCDAVAHYLREHDLAPDGDLVAHLAGAPRPAPDEVALHRVLARLVAPPGDDPAWPVPVGAGPVPGSGP